MKRNNFVIYTSLTGNYDRLPNYDVIDSRFDYICFSNDLPEGTTIGHWEIRSIPFRCKDKTRLSRFVKLNPHIVLHEYEYSMWLDSNLSIISSQFYDIAISHINSKHIWCGVKHPLIDCIYDDAKRCIMDGRDLFDNIIVNVRMLRDSNYPRHYGLFENNLILRAHNNSLIISLDSMWWEIYCNGSKRDQLSLFYIFWRNNFYPSEFFPENYSTRNHPSIIYNKHSKKHILRRIVHRIIMFYNMIRLNKSKIL